MLVGGTNLLPIHVKVLLSAVLMHQNLKMKGMEGSYQGQIQEFLIEGVQTLVQKGLLNFFVANYFSETTTCFSICGVGNTVL